MDVVSKITLVASIVLMGYSASQLVANSAELSEKADEIKTLMKVSESRERGIRLFNFAISFSLLLAYVFLAHFSGLAYWVSAVIAFKLAFTLFFSDRELRMEIRGEEMDRRAILLDKADSFLNVLLGLSMALVLVL
ncbi:hypothetical protein [Fibrobacter sp.]